MLQNYSKIKVFSVFCDEPTKEHYLIEISRKANLAHTSVARELKTLKKAKIISERKDKKNTRKFPVYMANLDGREFREYKVIMNLLRLKESGIVGFLKKNLMPKAIVLFGSYSRGEDIETSDVDIFVECRKENLDLSIFEKRLARKVELHFKERFRDLSEELRVNIINGLVLEGYLEVY